MALAHRFNINSQSTNGTETGTNLSLNDIIPVQPVTKGTSADDEKVTLQQLQSIPYGLGALNGSTYNVTLVNYPADYTLRVGSKMIVKFASAKSGSTVLNLAINGQTIPMLMQGSSLTEIAANQIIEFTFIGTISGSAHTITGANASAGITTSQLNGALIDYATLGTVSPLQANNVTDVNDAVNLVGNKFYDKTFTAHYTATNLPTSFSGNWRIDFRVRYISGGYTQAVQIAYSMPVGSNDNQLITKMFIRSVYYKDNTYTFGSWQKYVTESDVNTTLANLTDIKGVGISDVNNAVFKGNKTCHFYTYNGGTNVPTELSSKNYNFHVISQNIQTGDTRYRTSQILTTSDGTNPNLIYTRNGYCNDGTTWVFGSWEKLATETIIANYKNNYNDNITYWKLPRYTKGNYYNKYQMIAGGFLADIFNNVCIIKMVNENWGIISGIKVSGSYIYLKVKQGELVTLLCDTVPIKLLEISITTDSSEYDAITTSGILKNITLS